MIVTVIVVGPVAIFFSVCFIVFMVEANAVAKRKTVMRGDEINRILSTNNLFPCEIK